MEQIERSGLLDTSMIMLTTDHGTHNGSHGRTGKNWVLWDEISHIPLIIRHPEYGRGTRPTQFVQPIDFFPTVMELTGIDPPEGLHGRSLLPLLKDPTVRDDRDAVLFGNFGGTCNMTDGEHVLFQGVDETNPPLYAYTGIITNKSAFDWNQEGKIRCRIDRPRIDERDRTRLYDLKSDPAQTDDISNSMPDDLRRMQKKLTEKLKAIDAPSELFARFGL
jgi:arylsulfatase A-like enzyme